VVPVDGHDGDIEVLGEMTRTSVTALNPVTGELETVQQMDRQDSEPAGPPT
jgi:hypothetical protein